MQNEPVTADSKHKRVYRPPGVKDIAAQGRRQRRSVLAHLRSFANLGLACEFSIKEIEAF